MKRELEEIPPMVAETPSVVVKRVKKPWTMETKILRAWSALLKNPVKSHSFDSSRYILSLRYSSITSAVYLSLTSGYVQQNLDITMSSISNLLLILFHREERFQHIEKLSFEICLNSFRRGTDFFTDVFVPDGWFRMDSIDKVFFQRGPVTIETEIRGIESYRSEGETSPVFQSWSITFCNIEPTTTAIELKALVENGKEKLSMPSEMNIIEMRHFCHEEDFTVSGLNYYKERNEGIIGNQKQYTDAFPAGVTDWTRPLSKFPQMCDHYGNMQFVAYAVAETDVLM